MSLPPFTFLRNGLLRILSILSILTFGAIVNAQTMLRPSAPLTTLPTPALKRGIGYHGPLTWGLTQPGRTGYQWPPYSATQYDADTGLLAQLKEAGFDHVRLSIDPGPFLAADPKQRAALDAHLLGKIALIHQAGLDVVSDLHPIGMMPQYNCAHLLSDDFFPRYLDLAKSMARLLMRLDTSRIAFEPINEPCLATKPEGDRKWERMMLRLHDAIREVAPTMLLVVAGNRWGTFAGLASIDTRPYAGSNVIFTFHYYAPFEFTHQGIVLDAANPLPRSLTYGLRYPARSADKNTFISLYLQRVADATLPETTRAQMRDVGLRLLDQYFASTGSRGGINQDFRLARNWAMSNHIHPARIYLGEFGVVGQSTRSCLNGIPASEDRIAWVRDVRDAAETAGFGWAYWALSTNCTGMQLVKPTNSNSLDPSMTNALLQRN